MANIADVSSLPPEVRLRRQAFGTAVRDCRVALGLTQEDVAVAAGFERKSISRIETGAYAPTLDRIWRLADVLQVSVDELFRLARAAMTADSDSPPVRQPLSP